MTGIRSIGIKFAAVSLVTLLLFMLLLNTMINGVSGSKRTFSAQFADVSGLALGDDVKVAGVRVGRVESIDIVPTGAKVGFVLVDEQPLLASTNIVMRYQNLLGQRYLSLQQGVQRGAALRPGAVVPMSRTSPGFDLTELLNGFRPLFETLNPADLNQLATSLVKVLQGEGGTVESLLKQTAQFTNFLANRDAVYGEVVNNLTPVLNNLAGQGDELRATVEELKALMTGLAEDRKSIGASISGVSQLIVSTSDLIEEARDPAISAVKQFRTVAEMLSANRQTIVNALDGFSTLMQAFGRPGSYENALNIYLCTVWVNGAGQSINLAGGQGGPWSKVCQ